MNYVGYYSAHEENMKMVIQAQVRGLQNDILQGPALLIMHPPWVGASYALLGLLDPTFHTFEVGYHPVVSHTK